ncbi:MAG: peptidoglycan binding protein CsiV [Spongiibacteraceae bacterium]
MKKIIRVLALALLSSTTAQAETLYQVELIALARNSADAESEENWDRKYTLHYPQHTVALQPADGSDAPFQSLGADAMQLKREADAIAARRNWRVLLHTAWRQTVDNPQQATAIAITGGKQFGTHYELEGTFTLSVDHFLRADANLWLSRFATGAMISPTTLPNPPGTIVNSVADSSGFVPTQIVVLQEQRRLRSGELHYFDHPRLGLIVLVTPIKNPQ